MPARRRFRLPPELKLFVAQHFLSFNPARHQQLVVKLPSLNSPERMRRRWLVLGEFAKYAFCGLKRKRRNFERSVLKYVSIKIPALTHSGRKSRVCVNQPDRLTPPAFLLFILRQGCLHPALRALDSALRRCLGRLCGAQQGGAGYGATPPSRPPLASPRSTP